MSAPAPKPRLLVTTTTLPRWAGDPEPRFILDLCRYLAESFDVTIVAPASPGAAAQEMLEGLRVQRYRYAPLARWERLASPGAILPNIRRSPALALLVPFLLMGQVWHVGRLVRRERFDAIHCHWVIPGGLVAAALRLLGPLPPMILNSLGGDAFTLNGPLMRRLKGWILSSADAVTAMSREIAATLCALDPAHRDMPVIPMGVDLALFRPADDRSRGSPGRPTILFAGRLAEKKGLPILLEALCLPALANADVALSIVGDGPLRGALEKRARHPALAGRVTFRGALRHAELADACREADIFCAPFVIAADGDREGMPSVILEAAATGMAIVASDIGGVADVIEDGVSGVIVPPGDPERLAAALAALLADPARRRRLGEAARRRVAEFAWDRVAARYGEVIRKAIRHSARDALAREGAEATLRA